MTPEQVPFIAAGVFAIALLYSSVGHAGASGYIAVMALFGCAPEVIKPTALALNILVACLASWQFRRAGHFSWPLFWPFAVLSVPLAFIGGAIVLPTAAFHGLVGAILLLSAARLVTRAPVERALTTPSRGTALAVGGGIGLLAGLTGTGGGIFLTPLLLFRHWAHARTAGAVSALFILVNSVAGLLGSLSATRTFPTPALALLAAAGAGGAAGSYLGSRRFPHRVIERVLALVLLIAGAKLVFWR